jgi:hypothetical protein
VLFIARFVSVELPVRRARSGVWENEKTRDAKRGRAGRFLALV